jgi:hypothetical protein
MSTHDPNIPAVRRRSYTRVKDAEFCTIKLELTSGCDGAPDRFSVTGTAGHVVKRAEARRMARENWIQFFDDSPSELDAMNQKCGTRFRSSARAAAYVLNSDGEFHGLDVERDDGKTVYLGNSWGQNREEIARFFPELTWVFAHHLNDMHAGCEHQDALGWGHGKTIALTSDTLTEAQRTTIEASAAAACAKRRDSAYQVSRERVRTDRAYLRSLLSPRPLTVSDVETAQRHTFPIPFGPDRDMHKMIENMIRVSVDAAIQPEAFDAQIFKDSVGAPCPECGYRYGSAWLARPLPPEVYALFDAPFDDTVTTGAK